MEHLINEYAEVGTSFVGCGRVVRGGPGAVGVPGAVMLRRMVNPLMQSGTYDFKLTAHFQI